MDVLRYLVPIYAWVKGNESYVANVRLFGSYYQDVVFHESTTHPMQGNIIDVLGFRKLIVEITGTSQNRLIEFRCIGPSGTEILLSGVNLFNRSSAVYTEGINEIWQFDVVGLSYVYFPVVAVSGGTVIVTGRLVA